MPQGYFPVLLITFRSFLVLRGGTHSILPKRRNPEYSEFWRFFLSLGVGLGPEFTCWNMGAFLRYGNFALTLPFLPVQFCRVLAKGRHWRILFGLNLAFHGDPWRTSLFSRRKKILQHKCSFIWVGIPSFDMMKLCPYATERHQFGAVRNFLHCMLLWPSAPVQAVPHHIMTVYVPRLGVYDKSFFSITIILLLILISITLPIISSNHR